MEEADGWAVITGVALLDPEAGITRKEDDVGCCSLVPQENQEEEDAVLWVFWKASRALGYGVARGRRKLGSALNGRKIRALIAGSG